MKHIIHFIIILIIFILIFSFLANNNENNNKLIVKQNHTEISNSSDSNFKKSIDKIVSLDNTNYKKIKLISITCINGVEYLLLYCNNKNNTFIMPNYKADGTIHSCTNDLGQ